MDWKRLGETIRSRREDIGWSQTEAATAAGIDRTTWSDLERASRENYTQRTFRTVEKALRWESGSCDLILEGGHFVLLVEPTPEVKTSGGAAFSGGEVAELRREVAHLTEIVEQLLKNPGRPNPPVEND